MLATSNIAGWTVMMRIVAAKRPARIPNPRLGGVSKNRNVEISRDLVDRFFQSHEKQAEIIAFTRCERACGVVLELHQFEIARHDRDDLGCRCPE